MLTKIAIGFGVILLVIGALGFVPAAAPNGHLLGVFHVDALHDVVHLMTGAIAIVCGLVSVRAAKTFFQLFGIIYGLVAVLGFASGDQPILGVMANNIADAWLHVGIAAVSLALGFFVRVPEAHAHAHQSY